MNYKFEDIKNEMQGPKGLIKKVRDKYLTTTNEMAIMAQNRYENSYNTFENIDFALNKLLEIEYNLYLDKQEQINNEFISFADNEATVLSFPHIRDIIDDYKKNILNNSEATKILSGITMIITALADSNRQSRVSRSGSSLMHHISYLLQKRGFIFGTDYQREYVLKEGCKLDFFFPDLDAYKNDPNNCCAVACQTTSNDRFRLTFAQMPRDTRNRACTAIGNSNFGKNLGPDSLTNQKLQEAKKEGVKFVIIGTAIDERLKNSSTVMSYEEWFQELNIMKLFHK